MNRYRGPASGGQSKASASTLCQKCLKRDIYECKTTAQERPYASRPSRTQQLANPKLVPKLTSDIPNDLLRKKGIADEQLARLEKERGRGQDADKYGDSGTRDRSMSSGHSSVSTISTNLSRSPSPLRTRPHNEIPHSPLASVKSGGRAQESDDRKRRKRSRSSSQSFSSTSSYHRHRPNPHHEPHPHHEERNTRRRRSSVSPGARGRRRSRSVSADLKGENQSPGSGSWKRSSYTKDGRYRDDRDGKDRPRRSHDRSYSPATSRRKGHSRDRDRYGVSYRGDVSSREDDRHRAPPPRRDRSLSPYSKRLALTQAMNLGY